MIIKNAMEDIVTNAVIEMLKDNDEKLLKCSAYIEDIVCYVLNRIPPRYVTSGRGVLHFELEKEDNVQQLADIYAKIKEAREIIANRRKEKDYIFEETDFFFKDNVINTSQEYLNFPYFTGRVIMSSREGLKENVKVSLFIKQNGKYVSAEMINHNWQNPFVTSKYTYGYYTFWVKPICVAKDEKTKEHTVYFKLRYESESYEPQDKFVEVNVTPENAKYLSVRTGFSIRIEDTVIDLYQ